MNAPDKSWAIFNCSFGEICNHVCMELESINFKREGTVNNKQFC